MKWISFIILLFGFFFQSQAQFGISYHQSNIPSGGINLELNDRFIPELRFGTDAYFEDVSIEALFNIIFKSDEIIDVYTGIGGRVNQFPGLVVPIGINIYPFEDKKFGFHMELAGITDGESTILRGSLGIRYRFIKKE